MSCLPGNILKRAAFKMQATFTFVLCSIFLGTALSQTAVNRLSWPSNNAELKIVPHVEVPMTMAPSVQSGMNMKLPITLKFPSFYDVMRPLRTAALNVANNEPQAPDSKPREETSMPIIDKANSSRINSRAMFYKSIESSHATYGKACLLRAICEVAEIPAISSGTGLVGEIVDLLLT